MSLQKKEKLLEKETGNPGGKDAPGYDWSILTTERQRRALLGGQPSAHTPLGVWGLPEDKGSEVLEF